MKKLRLELDELSVESFAVSETGLPEAGTVQGNMATFTTCLCSGGPTCGTCPPPLAV